MVLLFTYCINLSINLDSFVTSLSWNLMLIFFTDSWYRSILSLSIVQMQEKGKLKFLSDKWWKEKRGGGACHVRLFFYIKYYLAVVTLMF